MQILHTRKPHKRHIGSVIGHTFMDSQWLIGIKFCVTKKLGKCYWPYFQSTNFFIP